MSKLPKWFNGEVYTMFAEAEEDINQENQD